MEQRRKRAVLLAVIPAVSAAWFVPLVQHLHHSAALPWVVVGYGLCMAVPLALATAEVTRSNRRVARPQGRAE